MKTKARITTALLTATIGLPAGAAENPFVREGLVGIQTPDTQIEISEANTKDSSKPGALRKIEPIRTEKLTAILEALKKKNAASLSSILPKLEKEEASRLIRQISKSWGDLANLSIAKEKLPREFGKGSMETLVHWGNEPTSGGKWLELQSKEVPDRWLRIGLLFPKGSSEPKQFLAVEFRVK